MTDAPDPPPARAASREMRDLPMTLPSSLEIAVIRVPVPMSEVDFDALMNAFQAMRPKLTGMPVVKAAT